MSYNPPQLKYILGAVLTGGFVYLDPFMSLSGYVPFMALPSLEAMVASYGAGLLSGVDMGDVWKKRFALSSALGAFVGFQFGPNMGLEANMAAAIGAAAGFYGTAVYPDPHPVFNTVAS